MTASLLLLIMEKKLKSMRNKTILSNGGIIEEDLTMKAKEWLEKNNVDLKKYTLKKNMN